MENTIVTKGAEDVVNEAVVDGVVTPVEADGMRESDAVLPCESVVEKPMVFSMVC